MGTVKSTDGSDHRGRNPSAYFLAAFLIISCAISAA